MARPLPPAALYPAGVPDIATRIMTLSTGVRVRVAECGSADAPAVVLLHGWGGSLYMFRHALALLPGRGLRAIAVDLRGHGLSDRPLARGAYSLEAYIADLDALLDALELPRAALAGQSMGGGISLHYALRNPDRVRALALINPACLVPVPLLRTLKSVPRAPIDLLGERLIPRWLVGSILRRIAFGDASRVTEPDVDQYWAPTQIAGCVQAMQGSIDEFDWRPLAASVAGTLAVPSVVILGSEDRLVRRAGASAEQLAGSRVYSLAGGHCVHEESPTAVFRLIGDFLGATR